MLKITEGFLEGNLRFFFFFDENDIYIYIYNTHTHIPTYIVHTYVRSSSGGGDGGGDRSIFM